MADCCNTYLLKLTDSLTHSTVWLITFTFTFCVCFCSLLSCLIIVKTAIWAAKQLGELLASLAARCHVCLLSSLHCILFIAQWTVANKYDSLIAMKLEPVIILYRNT